MVALIGKKIGMTQIFSEDGTLIPVTALEVGPCPVLAIRPRHVQLGFDPVDEKRLKKPQLGFFHKLNVPPRKVIREFLKDATREYKVGEELKVDLFKEGDFVDVTGTSIGKGFQGGMKRWNWSGGPKTHGSTSHRRIGSMGSTTTPGRVWKGHHLAGHMGQATVTVQNLKVVKVDAQNNLLLVKGAVPGCRNSYVVVKKSVKKQAAEAKKKTTSQTDNKSKAKK